jgi:hypothetical protein
MASDPLRMKLTPDQVLVMNEVLVGAPPDVLSASTRIGKGEVVTDEEAEAVVDALASAMTEGYSQSAGLTERGIAIDDMIGVVQQMAEHFYA